MTNIQARAMAILRDSFPPPYYGFHCEVVHGGVHGGEHYLAGGVTWRGLRRFFLLRLDTGSDLRALLINAFKSFKN